MDSSHNCACKGSVPGTKDSSSMMVLTAQRRQRPPNHPSHRSQRGPRAHMKQQVQEPRERRGEGGEGTLIPLANPPHAHSHWRGGHEKEGGKRTNLCSLGFGDFQEERAEFVHESTQLLSLFLLAIEMSKTCGSTLLGADVRFCAGSPPSSEQTARKGTAIHRHEPPHRQGPSRGNSNSNSNSNKATSETRQRPFEK